MRGWDERGAATAFSAPASFEMGLMARGDWRGRWIAGPAGVSSPLLRREFTAPAPVRWARCYVCGLGYYELYCNGAKVGDHVLDPANTYYHNDQPFPLRSRVLYVTYDLTGRLRAGANALGAMLGHGWYSAEPDVPPSPIHREPYGDRPCLLLQLDVDLADGRLLTVVSGRAIDGRVVRTAARATGRFTCSCELLNRIHQMCRWTFASSMQGHPQDAADRAERVGWLGDPIPEDYLYNFDCASFWAKWADDLADSQKENGHVPTISPVHWRRTHDAYAYPAPYWSSTYAVLVWTLTGSWTTSRCWPATTTGSGGWPRT